MDIYAQNIMDHYRQPRNRGVLKSPEFSQQEVNTTCGDELSVQINFQGQKIREIKFQGQGCAISQAAMSILSEVLIGQTKKKVLRYQFKDMEKLLGVQISERRYKCAMLGLWAIQHALENKLIN